MSEESKNNSNQQNSAVLAFKRILGYDEYQTSEQIIAYLKSIDSTQDFSKNQVYKIAEMRGLHLWVVTSETNVFVVKDTGDNQPKVMLNRPKSDFKFDVIYDNNKPRLWIENTTTTLPFDTNITGDIKSFKAKLQSLTAVHA